MADEPGVSRDEVVDESNVIRLRVPTEPKPLLVIKTRVRFCAPHHFEIDGETRTVQCSKCKAAFDPIAALLEIARDWHHYRFNAQDLRHQIERLQKERDELRRQVTNLKAQKKRATQ